MINLKLAEYNKEGKFERFIKLGQKFMYAGDFIVLETGRWEHKDPILEYPNNTQKLFDGLFSGRTYGGGRFILISDDEDGIYHLANGELYLLKHHAGIKSQRVGSIHENPELFERVR